MTYPHRSDCDDRCNGDWCTCPCHETEEQAAAFDEMAAREEQQEVVAAAEAAAELRELHDWLEGASEEGGEAPGETP